jgi:hypothetical protein
MQEEVDRLTRSGLPVANLDSIQLDESVFGVGELSRRDCFRSGRGSRKGTMRRRPARAAALQTIHLSQRGCFAMR